MQLRHLEHFLAVAECRSFTRAAEQAHVVQSALSASIRTLETELGTRLFDRTTRRVELTDAGRALEPEARRTLAAADAAHDAVAAVSGGTRGTIRIGIMHALPGIDLAGLLSAFHCDRPLVRLEPRTHPEGSAGLVADVADGRLDVAFAAVPGPRRSGVTVTELASEPIQLACPAGDRLATRQQVGLGELDGRSFIDVPTGWASRDSVDRLFAEQGVIRKIEVEVADVATVLQLVRAGLGVALVAPSSAPADQRTSLIPVQPSPVFTVSVVTPTQRRLSAATQALVTLTMDRFAPGWQDPSVGTSSTEALGGVCPR